MFIHPETRPQFVVEFFALRYANPTWTSEAIEEAAHTRLFVKNLEDTNMLLKQLAFCPGLETPIEEFESYLNFEEAVDNYYGDDESEI